MVFSRRLKNPFEKAPFLWFISLGVQRNEHKKSPHHQSSYHKSGPEHGTEIGVSAVKIHSLILI